MPLFMPRLTRKENPTREEEKIDALIAEGHDPKLDGGVGKSVPMCPIW
jgi:hypothetical protein